MTALALTAVASSSVLAYVYVGYPLLLRLLVALRGERPVRRADFTPRLTVIISAYNEATVIRRKLENVLSLDYPADALEVVVVSDASSDGTDEIVREFAARGVTLARQEARRGKTAGLNRTVPGTSGEIVVFSDANAMYEPDALRKLLRNFADPEVGCVTGEARYLPGGPAAADVGERVYWDLEIHIKRLETALGSMVGGDGAIYAIRRGLWDELPEDAINDFLNPLQIVAAGWRAVYDAEAICLEESAGATGAEYRRRVRIVSRSWRAVFQARQVLNPFRVGLFAWCIVSHKVLRWVSGAFAATAIVAGALLFLQALVRWPMTAAAVAVAAGVPIVATTPGRRLLRLGWYFTVINAASLKGVWRGSLGRVSGVWSTPRERPIGALLPVRRLVQGAALALIGVGWTATQWPAQRFPEVLFWLSMFALGYIYVGYPTLLAILRVYVKRPVSRNDIEPTVCLFITANDEAAVIEAKLQNALALDYPADRLDIVVASDGSVDATNAIVRRFAPRVRLLAFEQRRGKIAAINQGMREVVSDIVMFSDANTFLAPNAARALVRNFSDPQVGVVSGDVALIGERAALGQSEDLYYQYERWVQRCESEIGSTIGADGALYAIRRSLFVAPANDTILDDMAIPMAVIRSGYRVIFDDAAKAFEQGCQSAREEFSRKVRVVAGAVQFITRPDSAVPLQSPQVILALLSHKALRWLSPVFATCALLASLALAQPWNLYALAAMVQGSLVLLGIAGCLPVLRRRSVVAVAHYFCLVQAAAAVGFARGVLRRQPVLWRRFARAQAKPSAQDASVNGIQPCQEPLR